MSTWSVISVLACAHLASISPDKLPDKKLLLHELHQEPCAGMEESQEPGDGKATARALLHRLAERLL